MAEQIDLSGKTALITGATNGIGKASALALAKMGAALVLFGRNPKRGAETVAALKSHAGHDRVEFIRCDLSSQTDIRSAAATFLESGRPIHILLNNAGVVNTERRVTEDGFEETWAVNHLAYFLLTHLLLDRIKESAPARIVNVSSMAYAFVKGMQWDDLQFEQHKYKTFPVYGQSKLANIMFTRMLARRLEGTDVTVNAVHPGGVRTGLGQQNQAPLMKLFASLALPFLRTPEKGARTSIKLCVDPAVAGVTGQYWANEKQKKLKSFATDIESEERLWQLSLTQTGLD